MPTNVRVEATATPPLATEALSPLADADDHHDHEGVSTMTSDVRPNYGIDAPGIVFLFVALGLIFVGASVVTGVQQGIVASVGPIGAGLLCFAGAAVMVRSSRVSKAKVWNERLDELALKGNERALDVGCGRGLVTVELAKRLPKGEVVGIDVWRSRDQSGNRRENTEQNLALEGVEDRVEIVDADVIDLPFADGEFDVVTAGLTLHSIALAAGRRDAIHEIMRVTKPGGRIVIVDTGKTNEFQAWLNYGEWDDITRTLPSLASYPPVRTLTATKPRKKKGGKSSK